MAAVCGACVLRFGQSCDKTESIQQDKKIQTWQKTMVQKGEGFKSTAAFLLPLPIVFGMAAMLEGGQTSVCGLSFGQSHGGRVR